MKLEIYKCDFCKNEVQQNQLKNFYLTTRRYELCEPCFKKGIALKNKYEQKSNKIYDEFTKEIETLIKERN